MTNGITDIADFPKHLADKLVEMQRGDACTNCGSTDVVKHDGKSRGWCGPCLNMAPKKKQKPATSHKIQRNEQCPCKSGKKYKKCCLNKK